MLDTLREYRTACAEMDRAWNFLPNPNLPLQDRTACLMKTQLRVIQGAPFDPVKEENIAFLTRTLAPGNPSFAQDTQTWFGRLEERIQMELKTTHNQSELATLNLRLRALNRVMPNLTSLKPLT